MDTLLNRLKLLLIPRGMAIMLTCAIVGFLVIKLISLVVLSNFSNLDPQSAAILGPFHDFYKDRFDSEATGWVISTLSFYWWYAGKALRKIDRRMKHF